MQQHTATTHPTHIPSSYAHTQVIPIIFPSLATIRRSSRARLRPLRVETRAQKPVLVQSILGALPRVGNVLMLCGFIFLVFGGASRPSKGSYIIGARCGLWRDGRASTLADVEVFTSPVGRMLEARMLGRAAAAAAVGPTGGGGHQGRMQPLKAGLGSEDQCLYPRLLVLIST